MTSRCAAAKRLVAWLASARTGMTGNSGSSCTDGTASRALARRKACLKRGWAIDSAAHTKRVPSWQPDAPISRYPRMASPRPMPPATNTGISRTSGRISCASTLVETGPIWPPAAPPPLGRAPRPRPGGRARADMPPRLHALDDEGVGARAHQLLGEHERRGEADHLGAARLDAGDGRGRRPPPRPPHPAPA